MDKIPRTHTVFEEVDGWLEYSCEACGRKFWRHPSRENVRRLRNQKHFYCCKECVKVGHRKTPPNYKTGKFTDWKGYVHILVPDHPNTNMNNYMLEHRLVMEKKLGRLLDDDELVHHINGVRDDNRPENLLILSRKAHLGRIICPHCNKEFAIR